jgi:hypothetical protein
VRLEPFARSFADPIYRTDFFIVCSEGEKFHAALGRLLRASRIADAEQEIVGEVAKASVEECTGRCWRLERVTGRRTNALVVIWLRPDSDISVVTHEAWHAAFWIFQQRGFQFDSGTSSWQNGVDEPIAYYLQWLVRSILNLHAH